MSSTGAEPTDADIVRLEARVPESKALAALYERSCFVCHGVRSSAPLAGFPQAWKSRLAQGQEVLLAHVRHGFKAMPPNGLCNDCSDDEFRQLIQFMSSPE